MADPEHLAKLKEGVTAWNQWRVKNPEIIPNFSYTNLNGANLNRANLNKAKLNNSSLNSANLNEAKLIKADLSSTNFGGATLIDANLEGASSFSLDTYLNFQGSDLANANLANVFFVSVNLIDANLIGANLKGARFRGSNLANANLIGANLTNAQLVDARLYHANLIGANLTNANLEGAKLIGTKFADANLTNANLKGAKLVDVNFEGINVSGVNLQRINLSGLNLNRANLNGSILRRIQALATNFEGATLTSACIEDWNINSQTNLNNVKCDYIYLKAIYSKEEEKWICSDRRPHNPDKIFAPGEFTKLFQKVLETVDLIFSEGIEWAAFLESFQKLQAEIQSEELSIQAIERKSGGAFIVRVEVPAEADKAEIQKYIEREYEAKLKVIEAGYQKDLNAKEEQINIYRQQNANLNEIVKLLANKPINIRNVQVDKGNYNEDIKGDYSE